MTPVLEVIDLTKDYSGLRAVDGISFAIPSGTCFGLLGPNGAGKTTTIEIAEGIQTPTAGQVLYKGAPRSAGFREEIGIQFQTTSLLAKLSVRESLQTFRQLYRRPRPLEELIELCRLSDILEQGNDRISGGQRQRLLLAIALANDPQLIFLDEPTTGLDPQARRHLWGIVQAVKAAGKTVVLTTHYMEEAELLCDDIVIVDRGRIIARGSPQELLQADSTKVTIQVRGQPLPAGWLATNGQVGEERPATALRDIDGGFELRTERVNQCLGMLLEEGVDLSRISIRSRNLEDLFIKLTGRRLRD